MPCSGCPDEKDDISVENRIKRVQFLVAEAYVEAKIASTRVRCQRCLARLNFLIEGLEILSKMNVFADAYRETTDKWRSWITRMFESEIMPVTQLLASQPQKKPEEQSQGDAQSP